MAKPERAAPCHPHGDVTPGPIRPPHGDVRPALAAAVKRVYAPRRDGDPDAGRVIRARRRRLGWSIERAAKLAGCSTGMWSQLENAKRRPSVVMAAQIAGALGLTGADLDTVLCAGLEGVGRDSPYKTRGAVTRRHKQRDARLTRAVDR